MLAKDEDEQERHGPLPMSRITGKLLSSPLRNRTWEQIAAEVIAEQERIIRPTFELWYALLVEANHEERSARWLSRNVKIVAYWPHFSKKVRRRGKLHHSQACAVMPGLLFVPQEYMLLKRWREVDEYMHAHGFICKTEEKPAILSKAEIELIRQIEAKLNLPHERKNVLFKVGESVRFVNDVLAAFWGTALILEVASEARIGVEVEKAIGGRTKVYVPASEIEAM